MTAADWLGYFDSDEEAAVARAIHCAFKHFEREGRAMTNWEMKLDIRWCNFLRDQRIAAEGCCDPRGPLDTGECRQGKLGGCPLMNEARGILTRYEMGGTK